VSYPVTFEADYVERRSRLTAFFRLILAIPVAIVLYVYGLIAFVAIVIAWFAIVITGHYPKGLYDFVAGFTRCLARSPPTRRCSAIPIPRSAAQRTATIPCACTSPGRSRAIAA